MDDNKREKQAGKDKDVRNFQPSDYEKSDDQSEGLSVTHEQVSDTLTEGTIDGKIDKVDKDGKLISHDGEEIQKESNR